jgi:hypothetical protein
LSDFDLLPADKINSLYCVSFDFLNPQWSGYQAQVQGCGRGVRLEGQSDAQRRPESRTPWRGMGRDY